MNKKEFLKELSEKLNYSEEKSKIVNEIWEDNFFIGRNNKEKIINSLIEKLKITQEEANKIYNDVSSIIATSIKDSIIYPFN